MGEATVRNQQVLIKDRKRIEIDGVNCVLLFDEELVRLESCMGIIQIEGKELKIENLSKDSGKISVIGDITGLFYQESKGKKRGLFK